MLDLLEAQQHAAALEQLDDRRVGLEDLLAFVFRQAVAQDAGVIDIAAQADAVLHARIKVVGAVRGSGVDRAGAGVHGHIIAEHAEHFAIEEGMGKCRILQLRAEE